MPNSVVARLLRPQFIHRPGQIGRVLLQKLRGDPAGHVVCTLPWDLPIEVVVSDFIGLRVYRHGITALEACECVFRLCRAGDVVVDVGANHGVVTSAMAFCVGANGSVTAIEVMPETFRSLQKNVTRWTNLKDSVRLVNCAASDRSAEINVGLSPDFARNSGVAYVSHGGIPPEHVKVKASARRLDEILRDCESVRLMKLDVERHEYAALVGAGTLISERRVDFVVFEDSESGPSLAKDYLASLGFALYRIRADVTRPRLESVAVESWRDAPPTDTYVDFVATTKDQELCAAFSSWGYRSLRSRG